LLICYFVTLFHGLDLGGFSGEGRKPSATKNRPNTYRKTGLFMFIIGIISGTPQLAWLSEQKTILKNHIKQT
jgi:hypothetical protein